MGFSLMFARMSATEPVDADRGGLARWLEQRSLVIAPSTDRVHHLATPDGPLALDGHWTDLHLDPLDREGPVGGGIWHATLSDAECAFVYELCVAGRMLVLNPQGGPLFVVPDGNHRPDELPPVGEGEVAWVGDAAELRQALSGGLGRFLEFRDRAIRGEA